MQLSINVAIAVSKTTVQDRLVKELTHWAIEENHEFDIAEYKMDFAMLRAKLCDANIAFLDYSILERNRNDLGMLYRANKNCLVVFIGSPPEYTCRYLALRPGGYAPTDFNHKNIKDICDSLVKELTLLENGKSSWLISTRQGCYAIPYDEILYCQSNLKYVEVLMRAGRKIRKVETLNNVIKYLPNQFMRIHQSYVVNVRYAQEYNKSQQTLVLSDGIALPVSQRYRDAVAEYFSEADAQKCSLES